MSAAKLRELDENLCRAELSPAEAALAQHEHKQFYEALHPETKVGAAPAKREKGSKGGKSAKVAGLPSYTAKTAKATGKSRRSAERQIRRGAELGGQDRADHHHEESGQ